jgi:hypothetical protein
MEYLNIIILTRQIIYRWAVFNSYVNLPDNHGIPCCVWDVSKLIITRGEFTSINQLF